MYSSLNGVPHEDIVKWIRQMYGDNQRKIECCNYYPVGNYYGTAEYESVKAFGFVPRECELDSYSTRAETLGKDIFE